MRCDQARQLFDAYLDGELSPALATELGAHRVRCPDCRRALALLEVTGHVIQSDKDPVRVDERFTDRLLACMDRPKVSWTRRARRWVYVGGPLAAAAVIVLAFVGVFDLQGPKVLGERGAGLSKAQVEPVPHGQAQADEAKDEAAVRALEEWLNRTQENVSAKQESVQSLRDSLDLTIGQWLDILNARTAPADRQHHYPGSEELTEPETDERTASGTPDVEDL